MNLMNKMNTNNMDERSHRLMGIDKDDFNICETLNPSYIHSHYGMLTLIKKVFHYFVNKFILINNLYFSILNMQ